MGEKQYALREDVVLTESEQLKDQSDQVAGKSNYHTFIHGTNISFNTCDYNISSIPFALEWPIGVPWVWCEFPLFPTFP